MTTISTPTEKASPTPRPRVSRRLAVAILAVGVALDILTTWVGRAMPGGGHETDPLARALIHALGAWSLVLPSAIGLAVVALAWRVADRLGWRLLATGVTVVLLVAGGLHTCAAIGNLGSILAAR